MREILDCAVLLVPGHEHAMLGWVHDHDGRLGRVRLHAYRLDPAPGPPAPPRATPVPDVTLLARAALQLKRFDVCLLHVESGTLPWARTALACARSLLHTPLLGMVRELRAAAVQDLLALGMTDFIRDPACMEEMRARLTRLADAARADGRCGLPAAVSPGVAEPAMAYAQGQPMRARLPQEQINQALHAMRAADRAQAHEPFRKAKARVVEGFEREYLRLALARHGGNVAQAARASSKHRRAFWALMRKHQIDAAPYRSGADGAGDPDPA